MLKELDTLSQQIGQLILLNDQYRKTQRDLTQQLARMCARLDEIQNALEQTRSECSALRTERDALTATIDEAHAHLRALLEKLPQPSAPPVEEPEQTGDYTYGEHA